MKKERRLQFISSILLWTPTHQLTSASQQAKTYIHQPCVDTGCHGGNLSWVIADKDTEREENPCQQHILILILTYNTWNNITMFTVNLSKIDTWSYNRLLPIILINLKYLCELMSSSLLLQQCQACLVRLFLIVFVMGGWWSYGCCFVGCCLQDLFNISPSIFVQLPSSFFFIRLVSAHLVHPYSSFDKTTAWRKLLFIIYIYIYIYHYHDVLRLVVERTWINSLTRNIRINWNGF